MKIETTPWGSRLPDKPYYPLYLGNGVDAMLINLLGSGDCWFELMHTDYGAPLPTQKAPGWYKCDRRTKTGIDLVYGILFPLFEFASTPFLNGDLAVPRTGRQYFDPRQATLTTFYEQLDNETLEWMKVKVTTFLTKEHVLVEHYEFLETPKAGAAIVFFLNSPSEVYLHLYDRVVKMDRASLKVDPQHSLMRYDYGFQKYRGGARSWCDCECVSGSANEKKKEAFVHGRLQTRPLHKGESFTRYLVAIDNEDAGNYRRALAATVAQCRQLGYRRIRDRHQQEWRDYFATSRIKIPDPATAFVYEVSRYVLRANLHPSGFLPMANLPYLWQGVMFWDAGFAVAALLAAGNHAEARRVVENLHTYRALGRAEAKRHGARGMRLEWTVERDQFTKYPFLTKQVHNNAWWAHTIYAVYQATGDRRFLRRNFPLMEELLVFLTDAFLEDRGDHTIVRRCQGVDESVTREKVNDTWTCAVTLRALMDYRQAAQILKRRPLIENLDEIIRKLTAGLEKNVDAHGVMQSFRGGRLPNFGSLIFDLFPDHPALKPTLRRMMKNYDSGMKLYNFHGVTRYAEKAFPWANYWAARCFARVGDPTAHKLLRNAVESVNCFGGVPERVFYHGELVNHWFLTGHAALVWAANGLFGKMRRR